MKKITIKSFFEKESVKIIWFIASIFMLFYVFFAGLAKVMDMVDHVQEFGFICRELGQDIERQRYTDEAGIRYYGSYCGEIWKEKKK